MSWYSIYKKSVKINEMEKFPEYESYSDFNTHDKFEDYVTTLHELELKTHYVSTLEDYVDILPERKANVTERLRQIGWRYFEICRDEILRGFEVWKEKHQIQDAETWSRAMFADYSVEFSTEEEAIRYFVEELKEISLGSPNLGLKIDLKDISEMVDKNKIKELISEDFNYEYDAYESQIENFLEEYHNEEYEKSEQLPVEFMKDHDLEDRVLEYVYDTTDFESYVSDYELYHLIDENDLLKAMEERLYPIYMDHFGPDLEEVYESIGKAEARLNTAGLNGSISTMAVAVSLALNVRHVFGNIMSDYGESISQQYLDWLANETGSLTKEWQEEVKKDFSARGGSVDA